MSDDNAILRELMREHDQMCSDGNCPCNEYGQEELILPYWEQVRAQVLGAGPDR